MVDSLPGSAAGPGRVGSRSHCEPSQRRALHKVAARWRAAPRRGRHPGVSGSRAGGSAPPSPGGGSSSRFSLRTRGGKEEETGPQLRGRDLEIFGEVPTTRYPHSVGAPCTDLPVRPELVPSGAGVGKIGGSSPPETPSRTIPWAERLFVSGVVTGKTRRRLRQTGPRPGRRPGTGILSRYPVAAPVGSAGGGQAPAGAGPPAPAAYNLVRESGNGNPLTSLHV